MNAIHAGAPTPGTVEFVCTGNICRSPFAAAAAVAAGVPRASVHSSGLWADPGRGCPPDAVRVAAEFDIDLSRHGARTAEAGALCRRDWVLVMEYGQLREVRRLLTSEWQGRSALLGEFDNVGEVEIPDPYGRPLRTYREVYRLIHRAVGSWAAVSRGAP